MNRMHNNPCIRCGTQRIVVKTWKERVGTFTILNSQTACPDVECQKKVDHDNKKIRDKNTAMKLQHEQRTLERMALKKAEKEAKVLAG